MISVSGLGLRAGQKTLLSDVTFEVRAGEFVAVLGPNGAGKTTLLRTLAGVLSPGNGSVRFGEAEISQMHGAQRARALAHIASEEIFIDQLAVRDVVATGRYAHHRWWEWRREPDDDRIIDGALRQVGMQAFADRPFSTLSSGERQRVWLALALAQEAPMLLLDEPTSHLDVRAAQEILQLLRSQVRTGKSIVCVLHDINEAAQFADRIMLLGGGEMLAFDEPQRVLTSPALQRAYGIRMEFARTSDGALRVFPAGTGSTTEPSGF